MPSSLFVSHHFEVLPQLFIENLFFLILTVAIFIIVIIKQLRRVATYLSLVLFAACPDNRSNTNWSSQAVSGPPKDAPLSPHRRSKSPSDAALPCLIAYNGLTGELFFMINPHALSPSGIFMIILAIPSACMALLLLPERFGLVVLQERYQSHANFLVYLVMLFYLFIILAIVRIFVFALLGLISLILGCLTTLLW